MAQAKYQDLGIGWQALLRSPLTKNMEKKKKKEEEHYAKWREEKTGVLDDSHIVNTLQTALLHGENQLPKW